MVRRKWEQLILGKWKRLWACRLILSHKEQFQKTASHVCWILWLVTEELAGEHRLVERLWKSCSASSNKNSQVKTASYVFNLAGLITADASFWTPFKKEVVSLPSSSESQGTSSKNSFSCLLNIVTCDRGVGRRTPFVRKKGLWQDFCHSPFNLSIFFSTWIKKL